ncbi:MAG: flagellar biosynthesis anti-sigma factor FlgM [Phycisphaerales bacterium]
MPDIGNIGSTSGYGGVGPLSRPTTEPTSRGSGAERLDAPQRDGHRDRVELSEHARWLEALRTMPPIRAEKVAQVKAAIANGTYETDDKLNLAIDRLLDDVAGN